MRCDIRHFEDFKELQSFTDTTDDTKNNSGYTPLHTAVATRNKLMIEILIKNKANLNIQDNLLDTPLHWAANEGHEEIVQMLLDAGAKKDFKNNENNTPAEIATKKGHTRIVNLINNYKKPNP